MSDVSTSGTNGVRCFLQTSEDSWAPVFPSCFFFFWSSVALVFS
jgi:hypothetical protein